MLLAKLSSFYFFYFALLGVMAPYMGLFLESRGFSLVEIGQLMALLMFTKVIAPNVWGVVADRTSRRLSLVRIGAFLTALCFVGFFFAQSFLQYAFVIVLFSFFWNAVLAQFEVVTLHNLGERNDRYSQVRLWGSVGFILAVVLVGDILERFGLGVFPSILLLIILLIWCSSMLRLSEPSRVVQLSETSEHFAIELLEGRAYLFFLACLFLQLSHGAYYTYFSIYLETLDYGKFDIGLLWGLGVAAEVVLFAVMHYWQALHQIKTIMLVALAATTLRWVLIAFGSESVQILIFAQCLHALSFGAMHACAIQFVHQHFSALNQGKAQGLYSSISFGLGGAIGALASAYVVTGFGYTTAFALSAVASCFAIVMIAFIPSHLIKA